MLHLTTPEQLRAAAADLLIGENAAGVTIDSVTSWPPGTGAVLLLGQGDEYFAYGAKGERLVREELGVDVELPPLEECEPGVYYCGEEHEPLSAEEVQILLAEHLDADPRQHYGGSERARADDPTWAPWCRRLGELNRWAAHGAPTRTMFVKYAPDPEVARLSVIDGAVTCSCGSTAFTFEESHPCTRTLADNEDGVLSFYSEFDWFDGDDDPGVKCEGCGAAPEYDAAEIEVTFS